MPSRGRFTGLLAAALFALALSVPTGSAWGVPTDPWTVDGDVLDAQVVGNTAYITGNFRHIGTGGTSVDRAGLAAIDLTTGQPTSWAPTLANFGNPPEEIAVDATRVVVSTLSGLEAFDRTTGAALAEPTGLPLLRQMQFVDGRLVGLPNWGFSPHLVSVDPATGAASALGPDADEDGIRGFTIRGNTVYVGGSFFNFGGEERVNLAAFDLQTGKVKRWDPWAYNVDFDEDDEPYISESFVGALTTIGSTVYVAGGFQYANDTEHPSLAAFGAVSGDLRPWDPDVEIGFYNNFDLTAIDGLIYVQGFAAWDDNSPVIGGESGAVYDWNPVPTGPVTAVRKMPDGDLLLGGQFNYGGARHGTEYRAGFGSVPFTDFGAPEAGEPADVGTPGPVGPVGGGGGGGGTSPPPPALKCTVPNLKKLTKSRATTALKKANCAAGKITKPKKMKKDKTLKVKSQGKKAGTVLPVGTKITFKLGY